jgi:hypothetical protein
MEVKEINLHTFSDFAMYGRKSSYEIYDGFYRDEIVPYANATGVDFRTIMDLVSGRKISPSHFSQIKPWPFALERATLPPYMRIPQYRARNCSVCAKRVWYTAMGIRAISVEAKWRERETYHSTSSSTEIDILLADALLPVTHTNIWSNAQALR